MQNILAIWQREMKSYFVSPIAYAVLTVFLFISGIFFSYYLVRASQVVMMQAQFGQASQPMDIPGMVTKALFGTLQVILLFLVPMLTMGLFSEERKRGTIELLLTTPVGNFQAIAGKYIASLTFLAILVFSNVITILPIFIYGHPELKPILSAYLGLFLYGSALLAVGLFVSTLTENQIISVIITFGISLFFLLVNGIADWLGVGKNVVDYLSVTTHIEQFIDGVIDTSNIIYYLTFAFVGLFLAYRSLESMRWKG
jgi:ABC-2 type transport system permease protein